MTVITPPGCTVDATNMKKTMTTGENEPIVVEIINSSEDEETIPPPPPVLTTSTAPMGSTTEEFGARGETPPPPPPPIFDEEDLSIDDINFNDDDLNDPFILEFYRSFWGQADTTVDRRVPTPPSPLPSSSSSMDWESENFRPPTPPRRRGFGSLEIQDRQYPFLGMHCYEQIWRARILVPRTTTQLAVTDHPSTGPEEYIQRSPVASPYHSNNSEPTIPLTPGRGWMGPLGYDHQYVAHDQPEHTMPYKGPRDESPVPSPPPLNRYSQSSTETPPYETTRDPPRHPLLDQLPSEIQRELQQKREANKGTRGRFRIDIWGHPYRISIARNGDIGITRI